MPRRLLVASSPYQPLPASTRPPITGHMVVRKRPRQTIPRTTSTAEFAPSDAAAQLHPSDRLLRQQPSHRRDADPEGGQRRNTGGALATATQPSFLTACGLCRRRLGPGRDTFMYRGDIAFCSLECRQQHINQDEKEKCSLTCMKDTPQAPSSSGDSENCGTAAAA